jgi:hypothetical protein
MKNYYAKIYFTVLSALCLTVFANAQLTETFDDGDFTSNPAWVGNTQDWIVNATKQLQSNNTVANSTFYLSTANSLATSVQWEFYAQLAFSTSGANYVDVYLTASASDVTLAATTGYFVRIGNTADEISLYRKDAGTAAIKIIDGADGVVGGSNNTIKIKVTRDAGNVFTLYRDITGTGNSYISEGNITDATYLTSAWFGILVKQSTASFFQKHYFDDIFITNYVPDTTPPSIVSAIATSANMVDVLYSEAINKTTAENTGNYSVNNSIGSPSSAVRDAANPALVHLNFSASFASNIINTITITGIKDLAGNTLTSATSTFLWYVVGIYSVVIDEIMADPTPQVGLPNAEWIELKNTTPVPINLQGYRIGKPAGVSGPLPSFVLQPDSFVIVTTSSQVAALSAFGKTVSVTSFPSLGNDGDNIFLQSNTGNTIHFVNYSSSWYGNVIKADGGWTLEMIDPKNPCAGASNWKASVDASGGTPGKKNSVDAVNKDQEPPLVLRAYAPDSLSLTVFFNEPIDATSAGTAANYSISDGIGAPVSATADVSTYNKVNLVLPAPLVRGKVYTVTVSNVSDCSGNTLGSANSAKVGLATPADSFDIVVNEILFNPKPTGVDYLELYNRSGKIIDLSKISIANRSSTTGNIGSPVSVSADNYLFFPGDFIALTPEPQTTSRDYLVKYPDAVQQVNLPSFPDTKGYVLVLNSQGAIIDELDYSYKWHFALVDNEEGISLERIDYGRPSNDASNWTSAASSAGFGTPGYINSQYRADLVPQGEITLNPKLFSPDNDGFEDFTLIEFKFPEPGYVANITIFDAAGRAVKILQRNTTCAARGSFRWDGLDDKLLKVPAGIYVIYTDIFNLKGQKKQFKNTVVVAKKMR